MTINMPRGAQPTPRSALAAAEPYRPGGAKEIFVPSGEFPTPNHEVASAPPYKASGLAPDSFLAWPVAVGAWGAVGKGAWAEEAFAKACAEPRVFISDEVVQRTSQACGSSNFAAFMQTHGFRFEQEAYLDGPFAAVDWTNPAVLHGAIAHAGPVKIGVASADLASPAQGQVTPGKNGWAAWGLTPGQPENHWASLCGYGPLAMLVDAFAQHVVPVNLAPGMPSGLCYAMFIWGSIGIIDSPSLMNILGEAWVRTPATIVKALSG